jgi:hypothetical protein
MNIMEGMMCDHSMQIPMSHVTSVIDGLKKLYVEKLKPLEVTYQFHDFVTPLLVIFSIITYTRRLAEINVLLKELRFGCRIALWVTTKIELLILELIKVKSFSVPRNWKHVR